MGVIMCSRCDRLIDLDSNVEDAMVLPNGINWSCIDCCEERGEICEETGDPIWESKTPIESK